jgi:hypothetical protein
VSSAAGATTTSRGSQPASVRQATDTTVSRPDRSSSNSRQSSPSAFRNEAIVAISPVPVARRSPDGSVSSVRESPGSVQRGDPQPAPVAPARGLRHEEPARDAHGQRKCRGGRHRPEGRREHPPGPEGHDRLGLARRARRAGSHPPAHRARAAAAPSGAPGPPRREPLPSARTSRSGPQGQHRPRPRPRPPAPSRHRVLRPHRPSASRRRTRAVPCRLSLPSLGQRAGAHLIPNFSARAARPRASRLITVPFGMPSTSAVSA